MINEELLNKRSTYICLEYGTSNISKAIQSLTKKYCPVADKVPSHIFALVFEDGIWRVYESHMTKKGYLPSGVRTYSLNVLKEAFPKTYKKSDVYKLRLSRRKLKDLLGQPYGTLDIESAFRASILNRNGKQKNKKGFICSEYIACACSKVAKYFGLPFHCVTPAHFLKYVMDNEIQKIS